MGYVQTLMCSEDNIGVHPKPKQTEKVSLTSQTEFTCSKITAPSKSWTFQDGCHMATLASRRNMLLIRNLSSQWLKMEKWDNNKLLLLECLFSLLCFLAPLETFWSITVCC